LNLCVKITSQNRMQTAVKPSPWRNWKAGVQSDTFTTPESSKWVSVPAVNVLRLSYLLIALLLFQTAVAFYDSHEEVQDISTHVSPHHLDSEDESNDTANPDPVSPQQPSFVKADFSADGPDLDFCHHCCHCHGCGFAGVPGDHLPSLAYGAGIHAGPQNPPNPSRYLKALYRPPIFPA